jgi:putative endonuclease
VTNIGYPGISLSRAPGRLITVILSRAKNLVEGIDDSVSQFYVYIMASYRGTLYTGVTNDLTRRVFEHRYKLLQGFTKKYNISKLVFYETTADVRSAIEREKQIKGWLRSKKVALIESLNPYWLDLAKGWEEDTTSPDTSLRSA